jgi:cytochrome P450
MQAYPIPPGPRGKPIVGSLLDFRRDPLSFLQSLARDYGDVVRFRMGPQELYLLNHPDYIRDVLVTNNQNFIKSRGLQMAKRLLGEGLLTSEGEFHRRQRRLVQPAFHRHRVDAYGEVMAESADRTAGKWPQGETIDIWREMMRLTLSIVSKTLFDADVEAEASEIGEALTSVMQLFNRMTIPFANLLEKLPLRSNARFEAGRKRLDATIYRMIEARRASGEDRGDLLSMLLLAQDEEGDGGMMTDLQVRDEALTLLLAGHETTANALTWSWYLLSQNPDVEARMREEVTSLLNGRIPTTADVPRLEYAQMVFAEAMRLYPPAWAIGRQALKEYRIDRYPVPAGSILLMSPWVMHRDPRYYPEPLKFEPERWRLEAKNARPRFSYFPFGGGPRVCIGESFAWMEGVLILSAISQRWRLRLAPDQRVEPKPMVTLRPKYGMRMVVSPVPVPVPVPVPETCAGWS